MTVLPRSFALARTREQELVVRTLPFALPAIRMELAWHPGHERDPKHLWFRGILRDAVRAAGLQPSR
ncbi:hypothetical protein F0U60_38625 [Archangium minus]|uniref:Uncharacterized protein n=1 Tax=Archangium minus TaxID=83450 RepID=A0ABY9X1X4_9BACT|nr:hypothetical protein F0U60_38625 [Archangium minus]